MRKEGRAGVNSLLPINITRMEIKRRERRNGIFFARSSHLGRCDPRDVDVA